jgi:predicted acetyltransferase
MMTKIRSIQGDEMYNALYTLNSYSLAASPPFRSREDWDAIVRQRQGMNCHALFEDDNPVSIAVSTPMKQNMRGKLYPACGVWGVSTFPSARRKGYCRQVMASLLSSDHDSGKTFTNLYPFRESFYERLGYVAFPLTKIARFSTLSLSHLLKMDIAGDIKLQLVGAANDTYREYLAGMREQRHGMAFFDYADLGRVNQNLFWTALAEVDGKIEGLMLYRILGEEVAKYNFEAIRFYYTTSRARNLLLTWIARHIDQADRAEVWLPEDEYPECWLADIQLKVESAVRPGMNRVLDVEKIGGMQVGEGSFSAKIIDPVCPWNEGAWHFESGEGKLSVSRTPNADFDLTIQGLSALVSGMPDPQDFSLRGWGNPGPSQIFSLRNMFPPMRPFMHEIF